MNISIPESGAPEAGAPEAGAPEAGAPSRRRVLQEVAVATAGCQLSGAAHAEPSQKIVGEEHWARRGDVNLYLWRKRVDDGAANKPVFFMAHGSSFSGRGGFDLQVPGKPNYSSMDEFARAGFDVWTLDHENFGRSTRDASVNSDIETGVADLEAAMPVIARATGQQKFKIYGQSSGAIRAGVYAMRHPEAVEQLILDGFTWTGEGAPEIMRRRQQVESYRKQPLRKMDLATFVGIFSRDDPSTFEPAVPAALAAYELALGDTAPTGSYLDMAIHLPMVDPLRVACPVLITRAATDGNATDGELLEFFGKLPSRDKQFAMMRGVAHIAVLGINRQRIWHVMRSFLTMPGVIGA